MYVQIFVLVTKSEKYVSSLTSNTSGKSVHTFTFPPNNQVSYIAHTCWYLNSSTTFRNTLWLKCSWTTNRLMGCESSFYANNFIHLLAIRVNGHSWGSLAAWYVFDAGFLSLNFSYLPIAQVNVVISVNNPKDIHVYRTAFISLSSRDE